MPTAVASVRVAPDSSVLRAMAHEAAVLHCVPTHEVLVRLLLHLPREADSYGGVDVSVAAGEAERVAAELAASTAGYAGWQRHPSSGVPPVRDLVLSDVDDRTARTVLERFHYLGSYRHGSEHLGAFTSDGGGDRLAAMFTVAPLDVPTIAPRLPTGLPVADVAVLARVFAFDWAPRNTLSFVMARLTRALRRRRKPPRLLLTYLNPNVGFTGASYRASNWVRWACETDTRYAYLDGRYVTDRELHRRFGSAEPSVLTSRIGDRIAFSSMTMAPLDLYAYPIDSTLRGALDRDEHIELPRPVA